MLKKYIILSSFIISSAFSHKPGEGENLPLEEPTPPAEFKSLFKGKKIKPRRKKHDELCTYTNRLASSVIAVKKSHATRLNLDLYQEDSPTQEGQIQDILPLMSQLCKELEGLRLHTTDQKVHLSAPAIKALPSSLKELEIDKSSWNSSSIFKNKETARALERVELKKIKVKSMGSCLDQPPKFHKDVERLEFFFTDFKSLEILKKTLDPLRSLTALSLYNIGKLLFTDKDHWSLGDHNVSSLSKIIKRLKYLEINYFEETSCPRYFSSEGVVQLLQLGPQLESLSLEGFRGGLDLAPLAHYLKKDVPLKHLTLAADFFTFQPQNKESIQALFSNLESLSLTLWAPNFQRNSFPQNFLGLFAGLPLEGYTLKNLRLAGINEGRYAGAKEVVGLWNLLRIPSLDRLVLDSGSLAVFLKGYLKRLDKYSFKSLKLLCKPSDFPHPFLNKVFEGGEVQTLSIEPKRGGVISPITEDLVYSHVEHEKSLIHCILKNPHLRTLKLGSGKITFQDTLKLFFREGLEKIYLSGIKISDLDSQVSDYNLMAFLQEGILSNPSLTHIYCRGGAFNHPDLRHALLQAQERRPALKIIFD